MSKVAISVSFLALTVFLLEVPLFGAERQRSHQRYRYRSKRRRPDW